MTWWRSRTNWQRLFLFTFAATAGVWVASLIAGDESAFTPMLLTAFLAYLINRKNAR